MYNQIHAYVSVKCRSLKNLNCSTRHSSIVCRKPSMRKRGETLVLNHTEMLFLKISSIIIPMLLWCFYLFVFVFVCVCLCVGVCVCVWLECFANRHSLCFSHSYTAYTILSRVCLINIFAY
jgi:hypothetical protein